MAPSGPAAGDLGICNIAGNCYYFNSKLMDLFPIVARMWPGSSAACKPKNPQQTCAPGLMSVKAGFAAAHGRVHSIGSEGD